MVFVLSNPDVVFYYFHRWKRDPKGKVMTDIKTKKPLLEFIAIQRRDSGEWAIPGVSNYFI